jgi:hypothetical protein
MIAAARDRGPTPPMPAPSLGPGLLAPGDALGGRLFVQGDVVHAGRRGRFDDVVGRGFTLVSPVGDPLQRLTPDLRAFFASLGGIGAHVTPRGPIDDVRGGYAAWFAQHDVAVVLQRPDFHVFGAAATIDGSDALVAALRAAMAR